jgi:hypothetical protein
MRRRLLLASTFGLGVITGVAITAVLAGYTYPMHRRLIRSGLAMEEEARVYRAQRHGHQLEAIAHAWNAARLADDRGFRTFTSEYAHEFDEGLLAPLNLVVFDGINKRKGGTQEADFLQAIRRAVLARSLETAGFMREAEEQWTLSSDLAGGYGISRLRALAESSDKMSQSQVGISAEVAVLGADPEEAADRPAAQQGHAGDGRRDAHK